MPDVSVVRGDITGQEVDAVVNAANTAMRGGGGVDGAIHRAGGPAVLQDCVARFPDGLATGDAGWTTAGRLPARWVIHTVGPNYRAGQRDRQLLESCYRRALAVADELGASTLAFPVISAGIYGWPHRDAVRAAIDTIGSTPTGVRQARLVAFDDGMAQEAERALAITTALRILRAVAVLHRRGYHRVRILPGMNASGTAWRVEVSCGAPDEVIRYSTADATTVAGLPVHGTTSDDKIADRMLQLLPEAQPAADDPGYVAWYAGLMEQVGREHREPIAYADLFDDREGWEIGWGSGVRHPHPPAGRPS